MFIFSSEETFNKILALVETDTDLTGVRLEDFKRNLAGILGVKIKHLATFCLDIHFDNRHTYVEVEAEIDDEFPTQPYVHSLREGMNKHDDTLCRIVAGKPMVLLYHDESVEETQSELTGDVAVVVCSRLYRGGS